MQQSLGLVHEAVSPLGWQCLFANDNDPIKQQNYRANFPSIPFSGADIRELDPAGFPSATLATASFPCIDLSQAGGRVGIHGQHSGIVWSFLDHIQELVSAGRAPRFLLLENVPGLLTLHGGASIDVLLGEIARLGYVVDVVQVDARHFTAQSRNRVFIIGARDLPRHETEMPNTHIRRYKVRDVFLRNRHLPWHFFDFPDLPPVGATALDSVLEDIPDDDPRWWSEPRMDYFWKHLEHDHRPRLLEILKSGRPASFTAVRRGRRRGLREQIFNVRFDGTASCLRTPKGGSSIQFIIQVRNGAVRVRRITGLESARLQGVALPDSSPGFQIPSSEQAALFAFGDAVCVPAVRWVVQNSIEAVMEGADHPAQGQLAFDLAFTM